MLSGMKIHENFPRKLYLVYNSVKLVIHKFAKIKKKIVALMNTIHIL